MGLWQLHPTHDRQVFWLARPTLAFPFRWTGTVALYRAFRDAPVCSDDLGGFAFETKKGIAEEPERCVGAYPPEDVGLTASATMRRTRTAFPFHPPCSWTGGHLIMESPARGMTHFLHSI